MKPIFGALVVATVFIILVAPTHAAGECCSASSRDAFFDRPANFVAHVDHRGIIIDRMESGQPGLVVPARSLPFSGGPASLLRVDGRTQAALWSNGKRITVRQAADNASALVGVVETSWDGQALRLTFEPVGRAAIRTDVFERVPDNRAPHALGQVAETILDVPGLYRAALRDPSGTVVGWLRVRVSAYQSSRSVLFKGSLPASISGPLAAAGMARLAREVSWVEDHAQNVYLGN